jgi:hypothetical protein
VASKEQPSFYFVVALVEHNHEVHSQKNTTLPQEKTAFDLSRHVTREV